MAFYPIFTLSMNSLTLFLELMLYLALLFSRPCRRDCAVDTKLSEYTGRRGTADGLCPSLGPRTPLLVELERLLSALGSFRTHSLGKLFPRRHRAHAGVDGETTTAARLHRSEVQPFIRTVTAQPVCMGQLRNLLEVRWDCDCAVPILCRGNRSFRYPVLEKVRGGWNPRRYFVWCLCANRNVGRWSCRRVRLVAEFSFLFKIPLETPKDFATDAEPKGQSTGVDVQTMTLLVGVFSSGYFSERVLICPAYFAICRCFHYYYFGPSPMGMVVLCCNLFLTWRLMGLGMLLGMLFADLLLLRDVPGQFSPGHGRWSRLRRNSSLSQRILPEKDLFD